MLERRDWLGTVGTAALGVGAALVLTGLLRRRQCCVLCGEPGDVVVCGHGAVWWLEPSARRWRRVGAARGAALQLAELEAELAVVMAREA